MLPSTEHACTRLASEGAHPTNTVADFGGKCKEQPGNPFQVVVRGAHAHIGVDATMPKETPQGHEWAECGSPNDPNIATPQVTRRR